MIDLVMGMQFGSEGKGSVVSWLVKHHHYSAVVRLGGPNAGHTFEWNGNLYKMRQLPCAWHVGYPLIIPAGGVIDLKVLADEIEMVLRAGYALDLWISSSATVIRQEDKDREAGLMHRIGSTGSGTGKARAQKIMREGTLAGEEVGLQRYIRDQEIENLLTDYTKHILVESTQGFGLSLNAGFYPYCTSADISPFQCLADLGLFVSRRHFVRVYGVCRTFPIRVAGGSGEMHRETTWDRLRTLYGSHIPTEKTTVTGHVRRVGEFDVALYWRALRAFQPEAVFLTFVDYLMSSMAQWEGREVVFSALPLPIQDFVANMPANRLVRWLGVGIGKFVTIAR